MSDVIYPADSGNPVINGSIVVHVTQNGTYTSRAPDNNFFIPSGEIFTLLDERFDDVRYYTGDTPN